MFVRVVFFSSTILKVVAEGVYMLYAALLHRILLQVYGSLESG